MVSLIDLAPSTQTVKVGGADVAVYGVSAQGIASLLVEFPQLQKMVMGEAAEVTAPGIVKAVPEAVAAVIAAGTGFPGDPKAVAIASKLGAAEQLDLLNAIIELTMPKGFGPFVEALNAFLGRLDLGGLGTAPDTKSASPSKA